MEVAVTVNIDLSALIHLSKQIEKGLQAHTGHIGNAFLQWARLYRAFAKERYDVYSKGGGDWPPLSPLTILARRHGKGGKFKRGKKAYQAAVASGGGQVSILRDTNTLYKTLSPDLGYPGQLQEDVPYGVVVGIGGPHLHPNGGATIADIASFHQAGSPKLPQRKIIVAPPPPLVMKMAALMLEAVGKEARG